MCRASDSLCKYITKVNVSLLRTKENYEVDLLQQDKGVKEHCVFNDIDNFHIAENQSIDLMHDVFEGVANYTITKVLNCLILVKTIITLEEVNLRIQTFSYGNLEAEISRVL